VTEDHYRFLFCIPTTQLSGGVKIILSLTDLLVESGHDVDLFSYANAPEWCKPRSRLLAEKDLSSVDMSDYDFVVVSNAMFIPMVLPLLRSARCVFLAQDYESFHHSTEPRFESFLAESPAFRSLYMLPVPIIAISKPIIDIIREQTGKRAHLMPAAINKERFHRRPRPAAGPRKRVLLVGNYLMPYKGMRDALDAIEMLSNEIPVELVLVTQEERGRKLFDRYSFAKEVHFCPAESEVPEIIASCDVYCCSSWYEGLGLPALEAFLCGIPVVSTRTIGVGDYAEDGVNLLLANPNDPRDIRDKVRTVLTDDALAQRLVEGGLTTMDGRYEWSTTRDSFLNAIAEIDATYDGAGPVDREEMQAVLNDLEREGSLTPIETYRAFQHLDEQLTRISKEIDGSATDRQIVELKDVRDRLAHYVTNDRTQYYSAFKARYDFCLLLIELAGTPDGIHIQRLLHPQAGTSAATNAASLTEFRYTQP